MEETDSRIDQLDDCLLTDENEQICRTRNTDKKADDCQESPYLEIYRWDEVLGQDSNVQARIFNEPVIILFDVRNSRVDECFSASMFSVRDLERAKRFRFEINRNEYLAARGIIRSFLSARVGLAPEMIIFEAFHNAKPSLRNPECTGIDVSISHSAGRVACAFIKFGHIGVDIEAIGQRANVDINMLANRNFSDVEIYALENSPQAECEKLFLRTWTRKEAVLKGAGVGLSVALSTFDVLRISETGIKEKTPIYFDSRLWACRSVSLGEGFELSVAYSTA